MATARVNPSRLERRFEFLWRAFEGPDLCREYPVVEGRAWRFDYAHLGSRTAIEVEGGIWTGGRHVQGAGFAKDCEKYNEATFQGWRVFRLTDKQLTGAHIRRLINLLK